jgi:hypothetical protein
MNPLSNSLIRSIRFQFLFSPINSLSTLDLTSLVSSLGCHFIRLHQLCHELTDDENGSDDEDIDDFEEAISRVKVPILKL